MTVTVKTSTGNIYKIEAENEHQLTNKVFHLDCEADDYEIITPYYNVRSYEVGGPDYGYFGTFEEAKKYAKNLKFKLHEDLSVIKIEHEDGEEIWSTKEV